MRLIVATFVACAAVLVTHTHAATLQCEWSGEREYDCGDDLPSCPEGQYKMGYSSGSSTDSSGTMTCYADIKCCVIPEGYTVVGKRSEGAKLSAERRSCFSDRQDVDCDAPMAECPAGTTGPPYDRMVLELPAIYGENGEVIREGERECYDQGECCTVYQNIQPQVDEDGNQYMVGKRGHPFGKRLGEGQGDAAEKRACIGDWVENVDCEGPVTQCAEGLDGSYNRMRFLNPDGDQVCNDIGSCCDNSVQVTQNANGSVSAVGKRGMQKRACMRVFDDVDCGSPVGECPEGAPDGSIDRMDLQTPEVVDEDGQVVQPAQRICKDVGQCCTLAQYEYHEDGTVTAKGKREHHASKRGPIRAQSWRHGTRPIRGL